MAVQIHIHTYTTLHKNYRFTKYWGGLDIQIHKEEKKIRKVFLLQMLGKTSILPLLRSVSFWQNFSNPPTQQKCQNEVLCGNMNIKFYPYILKVKFFFKIYLFHNDWFGLCLSIVIIKFADVLSQNVCLITIHRNKTHLLNISCCHK